MGSAGRLTQLLLSTSQTEMESRKDSIVDEMGLNMVTFQKAVLEKDAQHCLDLGRRRNN